MRPDKVSLVAAIHSELVATPSREWAAILLVLVEVPILLQEWVVVNKEDKILLQIWAEVLVVNLVVKVDIHIKISKKFLRR